MSNVVFVSSTPSSGQSSNPHVTANVVVPSGLANSILVYRAAVQQGDSPVTLTSVVLDAGGLALPLTLWARRQGGDSLQDTEEIWHLLAPPAGTWAITAIDSWGLSVAISHTVDVCQNVDQTTPWNPAGPHVAGSPGYGGASQPEVDVTTAAGELAMDVLLSELTPTSCGQTQDMQETPAYSGNASHALASGSSTSMTWAIAFTAYRWGQLGGSLRPAATTTTTQRRTLGRAFGRALNRGFRGVS